MVRNYLKLLLHRCVQERALHWRLIEGLRVQHGLAHNVIAVVILIHHAVCSLLHLLWSHLRSWYHHLSSWYDELRVVERHVILLVDLILWGYLIHLLRVRLHELVIGEL